MAGFKDRFLRTTLGMAMYERFIKPHYHTFVRVDGCEEMRVTLPEGSELDPEFIADPFLIECSGSVWLFFEGMYANRGNRGRSKGVIGCLKETATGWVYQGVVLEEDYHLSFPNVFTENGKLYMIPESAQNNTIDLYESVNFPFAWRKKRTLVKGRYVDSALVKRGGAYYLSTSPESSSAAPELWCAQGLEASWSRHVGARMNGGPSCRRNGGNFVELEGRLYRVAQDCTKGYGVKVNLVPIDEISPDRYSEGDSKALADAIDWQQPKKHHTYNRIRVGTRQYEAVDRHYNTLKPFGDFMLSVFFYFVDGFRFLVKRK